MIQTSSLLKTAVAKDGTLFYADNKVMYCSSNGTDIDYSYTYSTNNYTIDMIIAYERYVFIFNKMSSTYATVTVYDRETKSHKASNQAGYMHSYFIIDQYVIVRHYNSSSSSYYFAYDLETNSKISLGTNLTLTGLLTASGTTNHHVVYEKLDNVTYHYYTIALNTSTASALTFRISKFLFSALNKTITSVSATNHTIKVSKSAGTCYCDLYTPERFVVNSQNLGAFVCNTASDTPEYNLTASLSYVKAAITPTKELITLFYAGSSLCYLYKDQTLVKSFNVTGISSNPSFAKITNYICWSYYDRDTKSNCVDRIVVGVEKQKGYKLCSLIETVNDGGIKDLALNETIIDNGSIILGVKEIIRDAGSQTLALTESIRDGGTNDLMLKETVLASDITTLSLTESILAKENKQLTIREEAIKRPKYYDANYDLNIIKLVDANGLYALTLDKKVYRKQDNLFTLCYEIPGAAQTYDIVSNQEVIAVLYTLSNQYYIAILDSTTNTIIKEYNNALVTGETITYTFFSGSEIAFATSQNRTYRIKNVLTAPNVIKKEAKTIIALDDTYITYFCTDTVQKYFRKERIENEFSYSNYNTSLNNLPNAVAGCYQDKLYSIGFNNFQCFDIKQNKISYTVSDTRFMNANIAIGLYKDNVFLASSKNGEMAIYKENNLLYTQRNLYSNNLSTKGCVAKDLIYLPMAYENNTSTIAEYLLINEGYELLTLSEEVTESLIYLKEHVYEFDREQLAIKEHIVAGGTTLPITETIKQYFNYYGNLTVLEWVTKPDTHLSYLPLYEQATFRPGEYGSDSAVAPLTESIIEKPYKALPIKETLVDKPPVQITMSNLDGYVLEDEFSAKSDPMVITSRKALNQNISLAAPEPLYQDIQAGAADYKSYGYLLTAQIITSTKKRYLMIPKVTKTAKTVRLFDYTNPDTNQRYMAYRTTATGITTPVTQADLRVYNSKTGINLTYEAVVGYENYLCYIISPDLEEVRIEPEFGYVMQFSANSIKIATYSQNEERLAINESVQAFGTGINQAELIHSQNFYYYHRDNLLDKALFIPPMSTNEYQSYLWFSENETLLFEVAEGQKPVIDYIEFRSGSTLKKVTPSALDYYTVQEYGGTKQKQVYGFTVVAPFNTNNFSIKNTQHGFTLEQIYDCYYQASYQDKGLMLQENIDTVHVALGLKQRVILESDVVQDYDFFRIREYIVNSSEQTSNNRLAIKEDIGGKDGLQRFAIKENVNLSGGERYTNTYYSEDVTAIDLIKLTQPENTFSNRVFVNALYEDRYNQYPVNIDFTRRMFLTANIKNCFWRDIKAVLCVGLINREGKIDTIEVVARVELIHKGGFGTVNDFNIEITPHIRQYIAKKGWPSLNNKIGYIGLMQFESGLTMTSMILKVAQPQVDELAIKEKILVNDCNLFIPDLYNTYYEVNQTKYYVDILTELPNVLANAQGLAIPRLRHGLYNKLMVKSSVPITYIKCLDAFNYVELTVPEPNVINNQYVYELDFNIEVEYDKTTDFYIYFAEENPTVYEVIFYYEYFTGNKKMNLTVNAANPLHRYLTIKEGIRDFVHEDLRLKEYVPNIRGDARILSIREKAIPPNAVLEDAYLTMTEKIDPQLSKNHLLLQECIPCEPQKDKLAIYEYVLENTHELLTIKDNVVSPKHGKDGKVMVETIK